MAIKKAVPKKKAAKPNNQINSREVVRVRNALFSAGYKTDTQIKRGIQKGSIQPLARGVTGHIPSYGKASHKRICEHLGIKETDENNHQPRKKISSRGGARKNTGGARPGSGRKKGAATKKTREIADKLVESGEITPLEYMLGVMRETPEAIKAQYDKGEIDAVEYAVKMTELIKRRDNAAEKAAPFIHPRLASIEAKVEDSGHEKWLALMEGLAEAS